MTPSSPASGLRQSDPGDSEETRTFVAQYQSLDAVREFVSEAAENCGFEPKVIYQIELATDEAFTNIVEHAYGGESNDIVECTCQIGERGLTIILFDCGVAFDPTLVPTPDLDAPLEDRETGGLGIYFMRKLMDEVRFSPAKKNGENCNILTMVKLKEPVA